MSTKRWPVVTAVLVALAGAACGDSPTDPGPRPSPIPVDRVTVGPTVPQLHVGDTVRVTARALSSTGAPLTVPVTWSSEVDSVVTVRVQGADALIEATKPGTTRVRATAGGRTGEVTVRVVADTTSPPPPPPPPVDRIEMSWSTSVIAEGDSAVTHVRLFAPDGTRLFGRVVTWESTDTDVFTVAPFPSGDSATVRGRSAGTAWVVARSEGEEARGELEVTPTTPPVAYVVIAPERIGLWETQASSFDVYPMDAQGRLLSVPHTVWTEDPSIAEIDAMGRIRGNTLGLTRLVAEAGGIRSYAEVRVYRKSQQMNFLLTYDWWDGVVRPQVAVGRTTWTDPGGVDHNILLYVTSGVFSLDFDAGTWRRVMLAEGHADIGGVRTVVATRTITEGGDMTYRLTGDGSSLSFTFVSSEPPYEAYNGHFPYGGALLVGLPVLGGLQSYLFRLGG